MSEYISRNTILKVLADSEPKEEDWRIDNAENYDLRKIRFLAASNVYEEIKDVLSCDRLLADVVPEVHAHWIMHKNKIGRGGGEDLNLGIWYECSHCCYDGGALYDNYCSKCGAKMDEEESENV